MDPKTPKYPLGLLIIGGFKFLSGLGLVALGVGVFRNVDSDPALATEHVVAALKLDPDNRYIHSVIEKASNVSSRQLRALSIGTFLYASMYLIEGTGLLLRKVWGEYFTVLATGFFIPLEIYEVTRKLTWLRIGILAINVVIVIYLSYEVWKRRRHLAGDHSAGPSLTGEVDPVT